MKNDLNIPDFLRRTETEDQAEARRAKNAPKSDSKGLKVKKLPEPKDPKIAKAIERDLKDDKNDVGSALKQLSGNDWKATQDSLRKAQTEHHAKSKKEKAALVEKFNERRVANGLKPLKDETKVPKKAGKLVERAMKVRDEMAKKAAEPAGKSAPKAKVAEKKAEKSAAKKVTIGSVASDAIVAGATNEEALKKVMKAFPDCSSNLGCMAWYRNKLRKEGKIKVPQKVR